MSEAQYTDYISTEIGREINVSRIGSSTVFPLGIKTEDGTEAWVSTDPVDVVCTTVIVGTKDSNCADRPPSTDKEANLHCLL